MKNFKKMISVWITVFLLVLLAGCSQKDKEQAADNEAAENTVTPTDADAGAAVTAAVDQNTKDSEQGSDTAQKDANTDNQTDSEAAAEQGTLAAGGIKGVYEQYGIKAGTCLSDTMIAQSKYSDLIAENFNSITLENLMKPDYVLNQSKSVASGDIVVEISQKTKNLLDWAKSKGLSARGHVLVWYSQTPKWIFYENFDTSKALVDRDTMLKRMESYIKQVFEQLTALGYADMFYAYDVVNEAVMENGTYRDCLWKQVIGDDYIWYAFYYADKYAPENIKLYYNDYNEQFKTDTIVKLAQSLVDKDGRSLIDGIGCQGHLYTKDSIDSYMSTLEAFSKLGLDVQITELDVSLGTWQNILKATDENLKAQGQYYYELINRIAEGNTAGTTSVSAITFWGFTDSLSWRRDRSPLLFDGSLKPKYAYFGAILDHDHAGY